MRRSTGLAASLDGDGKCRESAHGASRLSRRIYQSPPSSIKCRYWPMIRLASRRLDSSSAAISLAKTPLRGSLAHWPSVTDVGRLNRAKVCGRRPLLPGIRWVPVVHFTASVQVPDVLVRQRLCVDPRMQCIGIYLNARLIGGRCGRVGRWAYCESGYDKYDCDGSYG